MLVFLFSAGFFVFIAYISAWLILEKRPLHLASQGLTPKKIFTQAEHDIDRMERELQEMEAYVTSFDYRMKQEFKK